MWHQDSWLGKTRVTRLDSTLLVCTHCHGCHCKQATESLPGLCESEWTGLDSTLLVCTHPEVVASRFQDSRHMKVVRLSALSSTRLYTQEIFLVLISVRGWVGSKAIVQSEGLSRWKIPVTSSGIKPAAFQLRLIASVFYKRSHTFTPRFLTCVLLQNEGERLFYSGCCRLCSPFIIPSR